uniref:ATP synthase F0 subunit 8 n=1 Tax=Potamiscus yiwuensis TaxID=511332 RepID=A0A650F3F5_9EUCA|nr:ATP synthase F0 subunit 8 [Potamiscus yiwuensis]
MPQMSPLFWLGLFFFFFFTMMLFLMFNYFLSPYKSPIQQPLPYSFSKQFWKL